VQSWQEAGDKIIILTHFNKDIRRQWISQSFKKLNLTEVLTAITALPPTATHNRGTNTIDGIYVSPTLLPFITGGYLAFDMVIPSDHRALWVDIPAVLLGFDEEPQLQKPSARCLQCRDPRVVQKYVQHLSQTLEEAQAFQRLATLRLVLQQSRLTRAQQQEYEELDRIATTGHLLAEKQCRKFKMGQVPWTPDLTRQIYRILYWKGVISRAKGHRIGTSVLQSRARKAGLQHLLTAIHLPMEILQNNVAKATRQYRHSKQDHDRRDMWLGQMIEAQAQTTGWATKGLWKQIHHRERIKLMAKQVKTALGKITIHRPLAIVSEPLAPDSRRECTTCLALEHACLAEAGRRFTQANRTPCFQSPIWDIFGEIGVN